MLSCLVVPEPDTAVHYPKVEDVVDERLALWVVIGGIEDLQYKSRGIKVTYRQHMCVPYMNPGAYRIAGIFCGRILS